MNQDKFVWNHSDGFWYGPDLDPDEELDYTVNFANLLVDDMINTFEVSATNVSVSNSYKDATSKKVVVWLVSGFLETVAAVSVRVHTTAGRIFERTFKVHVRNL